MLRIDRDKILGDNTIQRVQFENECYFVVGDVAKYLNEDLSDVETINLPIKGEYKKVATLEAIEKGRKVEPLSEFNKALLKFKNKN